jgi:hypothetical protein
LRIYGWEMGGVRWKQALLYYRAGSEEQFFPRFLDLRAGRDEEYGEMARWKVPGWGTEVK